MSRPLSLAVLACALVALTVQVLTYQRVLILSHPTAMEEPPVCLISRWCSTGADPEFPCTEITVTTCPNTGETPEQLKARHKAAVQAHLAIWPQDCDDCQ